MACSVRNLPRTVPFLLVVCSSRPIHFRKHNDFPPAPYSIKKKGMLQKTRLSRVWALVVPSVTSGTWLTTLLTTVDHGVLELRWLSQVRKRGKIRLNQFVIYTNNLDKEHRKCTVSLFLFRRPVKHWFSFFVLHLRNNRSKKIIIFICPSSTHYPKIFSYVRIIMGGRHFPPIEPPPKLRLLPSL